MRGHTRMKMTRDPNTDFTMLKPSTAFLGIFLALAVIFGYVEALIPVPVPVPGIKLGLTNLVITAILYVYGYREALVVTALRVFIIGFLFGNLFSIAYGLTGAVLSLTVMAFLKRTGLFGVIGVSAAGGVSHNIAQVMTAYFMVTGFPVRWYMPILMLAGVGAGILTGIADVMIIPRLHRFGVR